MSDRTEASEPKGIANQLIAADGTASPPSREAPPDPMFAQLLDDERRFEGRVRRLAVLAWGTAFGCLLAFTFSFLAVRNLDDGTLIEIVRGVLVFSTLAGVVGLLVGALATVSWLFRPRRATLRAIERRLAALERTLVS